MPEEAKSRSTTTNGVPGVAKRNGIDRVGRGRIGNQIGNDLGLERRHGIGPRVLARGLLRAAQLAEVAVGDSREQPVFLRAIRKQRAALAAALCDLDSILS